MEELPAHAIRATDAEREQVVERLRRAGADGQLTAEELDERLDRDYAARTYGDLEPLTADLQAATASSVGFSVRPGGGGNDVDGAVTEEAVTNGGPVLRLRVVSVMGGTEVKRGRKPTRAERGEQKRRAREERRLGRS